jgi:hypothetical protein
VRQHGDRPVVLAMLRTVDKQALYDAIPEFIAQMCDPDTEWVEDPRRADRRVYRGRQGVRESFERWLESFDEYSFEIERIVDCGTRSSTWSTKPSTPPGCRVATRSRRDLDHR